MGVDRSASVARRIMQEFGWDRCAILVTDQQLFLNLGEQTKQLLDEEGMTTFYHVVRPIWFNGQVIVAAS